MVGAPRSVKDSGRAREEGDRRAMVSLKVTPALAAYPTKQLELRALLAECPKESGA